MAQFERYVLYKLSVAEAGMDDSAFTSSNFQKVIGEVASSLTSNAVAAAIAMKFSALCQGNNSRQTSQLSMIRDRIYKHHKEIFVRSGVKAPETPFEIERIQIA